MFKVEWYGRNFDVLQVLKNKSAVLFLVWDEENSSFETLDYKKCKLIKPKENKCLINVDNGSGFRDIDYIKKIVSDKIMSNEFGAGI